MPFRIMFFSFLIFLLFSFNLTAQNVICKYKIVTNSELSLPGDGYEFIFYKMDEYERIDLNFTEGNSYTYFYKNDSLIQMNKQPQLIDYRIKENFKFSHKPRSKFNIGEYSCELFYFEAIDTKKPTNFKLFCKDSFTPAFISRIDSRIKGMPVEIEIMNKGQKITITLLEEKKLYPANLLPYFKPFLLKHK